MTIEAFKKNVTKTYNKRPLPMPSSSSACYKSLLLVQPSDFQHTKKYLHAKNCTSHVCGHSWQLCQIMCTLS